MKLALVLPSNIYFSPYIKNYLTVLDDNKISYDIIFWDRAGVNEDGGIVYKQKNFFSNKYLKIFDYLGFVNFVKKNIKEKSYSKLIVFSPQASILLYPFLKKYYKNNFILDIRDLSIEQKIKALFEKVLCISSLNVVSSPGFVKYLSDRHEFLLCHNVLISELVINPTRASDQIKKKSNFTVTTIGAIRDFGANLEVINSLKNIKSFKVDFIGKGIAEERLKSNVLENKIKNVFFYGFYNKKDEKKLLLNTDFLNIYYPDIKSHSSALSNRFYLALILKIPMIVRSNSIQGEYVEKFNLGISIDNCDDLSTKLIAFYNSYSHDEFVLNCNNLLQEILDDQLLFEKSILKSIHF
jgi:hypothetical protein